MADVRQKVRPELQPFASRLTLAIERAGGLARIIKLLNKPRATIDRWMNAQAAPSLLDIADVAKVCGVSLEWLATGEGEPEGETTSPTVSPNVVNVPILDVMASAGPGAINGEPETIGAWPFSTDFLRELGVVASRARVLHVRGDSMYPTLHDRDPVLVDIGNRRLVDGYIYAFRTPDGLIVKRVQRGLDGSIALISDNNALYPAQQVSAADAENLSVLGRIHWFARMM